MKLSLNGLKATDRALDLKKLNLILAPNGVGKSSVNSAIKFLLLGHDPALGKRPVDTASMMRNGEIGVTLTLDDGRTFGRRLRRKGKSLEMKSEASWLRQATPSEHDAEILSLAGQEEPEAIQNLTIKSLLDCTPSQKATAIEAILAHGRKTPQETTLQVARLTVQNLAKIPPDRMPADHKLALPQLSPAERVALKAAEGMLLAKLQEGIPSALTWANESKNEAARTHKEKVAAGKEIEARLSGAAEVSAEEIATLEAEREKLQREIGAATQMQEAQGRQAGALVSAKAEQVAASTAYGWAQQAGHNAAKDAEALPDLKARHEKLAKEVIKMEPPRRTPCDEADRLEDQARAKLKTLEELRVEQVPPTQHLLDRVNDLTEDLNGISRSPWPEVKKIGFALKRHADDKVSAHGDRLVTIAKAHVSTDTDELAERIAGATREYNAAQEQVKAVEARNVDITFKITNIRREADVMREEAARARVRHDTSFNERSAAWTDSIRAKATERDDLLNAIRKAEQAQVDAATRLETSKARHEAAEKRLKELGGDVDAGKDFSLIIASRELALEGLKAKLEAAQASIARRTEFEAILAEIVSAQASRDVFAALEWALQRVREQELNDSAAPLKDRVDKFLKAAGRKEKTYLRASRTDCEIGWIREDGGEVAVQVLSGAEYCLFSTALAAAVIGLRKPPLKILIVEGGEVRADQLPSLMAGIAAVSDELDLALILYPHDVEWALTTDNPWQVTKLG